jgi:hypothetical protein
MKVGRTLAGGFECLTQSQVVGSAVPERLA